MGANFGSLAAHVKPAGSGRIAQVLVATRDFLAGRRGTHLDTSWGMKPRTLPRHLALLVLIKLAVLVALWWAFVRDAGVTVDDQRAAAHLTGAPAAPTTPAQERPR
jgi:hypothetical protein